MLSSFWLNIGTVLFKIMKLWMKFDQLTKWYKFGKLVTKYNLKKNTKSEEMFI